MDKYIVLRNIEAGRYIPKHDPSYVHSNLEDAVKEAHYDLEHGGVDQMAIYQVIQEVKK